MKVLKWILIIVGVLALALIIYLWNLGAFSTLTAAEKVMGPYTIAYERYVGPYQNTGKAFMNVSNIMKGEGLVVSQNSDSIGIYYDDPKTVAKDQLRSDCGLILNAQDKGKIPALAKKGLKVMTLPKQNCVVVEFPIKSVASYMLGPAKAYPVLMKYAQDKGYTPDKTYEYYDMAGKKIIFTLAIKK